METEFFVISVKIVQLFELHENKAKHDSRNFERVWTVMIEVKLEKFA